MLIDTLYNAQHAYRVMLIISILCCRVVMVGGYRPAWGCYDDKLKNLQSLFISSCCGGISGSFALEDWDDGGVTVK